jgi:hypothetical protein
MPRAAYPCEPKPFDTMFGAVAICAKCGHGYQKPSDCKVVREMQATKIALDMTRKLAVESGAVQADNRLITEPVDDIVDIESVIAALYWLIVEYEG